MCECTLCLGGYLGDECLLQARQTIEIEGGCICTESILKLFDHKIPGSSLCGSRLLYLRDVSLVYCIPLIPERFRYQLYLLVNGAYLFFGLRLLLHNVYLLQKFLKLPLILFDYLLHLILLSRILFINLFLGMINYLCLLSLLLQLI